MIDLELLCGERAVQLFSGGREKTWRRRLTRASGPESVVLDSSKLPGQLERAGTNNGSGTVLDAWSSMSLMLENFGRPGENTSPLKRLGHFPQRKSMDMR